MVYTLMTAILYPASAENGVNLTGDGSARLEPTSTAATTTRQERGMTEHWTCKKCGESIPLALKELIDKHISRCNGARGKAEADKAPAESVDAKVTAWHNSLPDLHIETLRNTQPTQADETVLLADITLEIQRLSGKIASTETNVAVDFLRLADRIDKIRHAWPIAERARVCGICGQPYIVRNLHPDAGKPEAILTVGAVYVCVPCLQAALHKASERASKAEKELAEKAQPTQADETSNVVCQYTSNQARKAMKELKDWQEAEKAGMQKALKAVGEWLETRKHPLGCHIIPNEIEQLKSGKFPGEKCPPA